MFKSTPVAIVVIPSAASLSESQILQELSESQVADDYLNHPTLPYNENIIIDKIGVLNFNAMTKEPLGMLRYGTLRLKKPDLFRECKDPQMDYEDKEQVSPVVIICGKKKFRTDHALWFVLSDIIRDITMRQGKTGKMLLPIEVFVDKKNQWIIPLLNLSKGLVSPRK